MRDTWPLLDKIPFPALTRRAPDVSGAVLIDATVGAGGHAERFLSELPGLLLIGLDRDASALEIADRRLARFTDRLTLKHARYDEITAVLRELGYATTASIDGLLFDLGVSSMQLDRVERGFSYAHDAPLDMRMDTGSPLTAAEPLACVGAALSTVVFAAVVRPASVSTS